MSADLDEIALRETLLTADGKGKAAKEHALQTLLNAACAEAIAQDRKTTPSAARIAWEEGFRLCRQYGDNHAHFEGDQKEAHWQRLLETIKDRIHQADNRRLNEVIDELNAEGQRRSDLEQQLAQQSAALVEIQATLNRVKGLNP